MDSAGYGRREGASAPNLAKSWDISKDNLTYTFHLVPGTRFSDGSPLTAEGDAWQFIETGDTDFASFTVTQENIDKLKGLGFLNILPYTPSTYGYQQVNLENEKLKDKRVRQALTYGLDRKSIYVDAVQGAGVVANIPASPIFWSYTTDGINPYNYDPEKAKKLLDEAGWPEADRTIRQWRNQGI